MDNTLISADNSWALFAILAVIAAISIYLEQRFYWGSKVTGCVLALLGAMALSNLGIIPLEASAYDFVWDYIIPLSIPMLLYNADIRKIGRESGRMLAIYTISGFGSILGGFVAYKLLKGCFSGLNLAVPMMIGTYTGGSVNLVAMSDAYKAPGDLVSEAVVADNLMMAIYFFVLVGMAVSEFFLRHYKHPMIDKQQETGPDTNESAEYWKPKEVCLMDLAFGISLAIAIVAVSSMLADFLPASYRSRISVWLC